MIRNLLKSTSILAIALGTSVPLPSIAQDAADQPCLEVTNTDAVGEAVEGALDNLEATANDACNTLDEALSPEAQAELEAAAEGAEVEAEATAEAETAPVEETVEETTAEAAEQVEETTETAEQVTEETVETAEETTSEAVEETAEAVEETEAEVEAEVTTEAEAATEMEAEPTAEAPVEAETETTAETEMEAEPTAEAPVEAETETTAESETATDTEVEAEAETTAEAEAEPELPEMDAQAQIEALQQEVDRLQSAAAAAAGAEATGEVVTETVTEDSARSSSEEFATTAAGKAQARDGGDDDGLSNFEKVALAGLGALVVGTILDNGSEVVSNSGDRVVVERDGQYYVLKDDNALLRQPGYEVATEDFSDGSSRVTVNRPDGTRIVTVRAADGTVLRRTSIQPDGTEVVLFDDTQIPGAVEVDDLEETRQASMDYNSLTENELRALLDQQSAATDRRFSLAQIRRVDLVRKQVPVIALDNINFATGSAVIRAEEAEELTQLGQAMREAIARNPREVFLIEGHTDAVGRASYNLALSDRRAESLALALTEYFDVPPENLVVQGYGESDLLIKTQASELANRRAAVRRITPLLQGS
ncbi:OmpA family protein [Mesobacterium pallidum]|uniref:OmpA family protein n=1 Tax=Mesobacterium pallidum TaxID=2872037 RepID=UPI001EE2CCA7|nr:OmpA family protein [Mesobacterium pallidum]